MPTELIGVEEVAKDLMFLAPFLDFEVGQMQPNAYGCFEPSQEIINAYNRAVKKFLDEHKIYTVYDLKESLPQIIDEYKPLHNNHELSQARIDYMKSSIDTLTNSIMEKQNIKLIADGNEKE